MHIWYLNKENQLPGDGWRQSRSSMICELLAERGHSVIWWTNNFSHHTKTFRSDGWKDVEVSPQLLIRMVPSVSYRSNVGFRRVLSDAVYAWRLLCWTGLERMPDLIIECDGPLLSTFVGARLAKRTCAALVLDVHDLMPELFEMILPKSLQRWERWIFSPLYALRRFSRRRADAVFALSDDYLNNVLSDAPALRGRPHAVVFNGIDVAAFRSMGVNPDDVYQLKIEKGKTDGEVWAIYAGSLGNNYDVTTLVQAAELLSNRPESNRIKLLIAGDGPLLPFVTEYIATRQLTNIKYLGRLAPADLIRYYQVCDIGLCAYGPYSNVAMPDKGYDYMAAGLAIVNSLKGEFERLLQLKQMGLQYQAGDAASFAKALTVLAQDDTRRRQMGAKAHALALQFDKHVQYPRFAEIVESFDKCMEA